MSCYRIQTTAEEVDALWLQLSLQGVTPLYSEESADCCFLVVDIGTNDPSILEGAVEPIELPDTDWEQQWVDHSPCYKEGESTVDLSEYGPEGQILLRAGAGFGDLSHPTTRLVLRMMSESIYGSTVLDLGCGSGILSLAALRWGATHAYAVDIDPLALEHTESNAALNNLASISYSLPENLKIQKNNTILLCNMIRSEQELAWKAISPQLHKISAAFISGILIEDREKYLALTTQLGWQLVSEESEGQWLGFEFHCQ
jgi:ribosomal protein L11 methyltransferase